MYKTWTKNNSCVLKESGRLQTLSGGDLIDSTNGDVNVCKHATLHAAVTAMDPKVDGKFSPGVQHNVVQFLCMTFEFRLAT